MVDGVSYQRSAKVRQRCSVGVVCKPFWPIAPVDIAQAAIKSEAPFSDASAVNWERSTLEKLAMATLDEQPLNIQLKTASAEVPLLYNPDFTVAKTVVSVLNPDGSLHVALAHMDLCEQFTPDWLARHAGRCGSAALVVAGLRSGRRPTMAHSASASRTATASLIASP